MAFPAQFSGVCSRCRGRFKAGALILYDKSTKRAQHATCAAQGVLSDPDASPPTPPPEEDVRCAHCGLGPNGQPMIHTRCADREDVPF